MLTSKERTELRTHANALETIVTVGKLGITDALIAQTNAALEARELIKCQVLEAAMLTAREACDALCAATGADGVQCIGGKFVIYRKSNRQQKPNPPKKKKVNPVRKGIQQRRQKARLVKQKRDTYFKQAAIQAAIEREKEKKARAEQ